MFFEFDEQGYREIPVEKISGEHPVAGYVTVEELRPLQEKFGFDDSTVAACGNANEYFRSGAEIYTDYTFTELRIMNIHEEEDDYIALYIKRNLILVVDIVDRDGSTREKFMSAIRKYGPQKVSCEKILAAFLDSLLAGDHIALEKIERELEKQEEALLDMKIGKDFNNEMLKNKIALSDRYNYYAQLLDVTDAVYENDNDIFAEENLIHVDNVSKRINRLQQETSNLRSNVEHLQDAYFVHLDTKMNNTMRIFTVLTSVFFPLTIIVGWYGMNFTNMPELAWKYGYVYVILLSVVTVAIFALIGKRKKWF